MNRFLLAALAVCLIVSTVLGGSTGKISGSVVDRNTGEPLIGANVAVEGTMLGAVTDVDGVYTILNVPPGTYTVRTTFLGYHPIRVSEVKVSVDLTTKVDFKLIETTIQLNEEMIIVAERPLVQRDLTSSSSRVSSDQIKAFPVEDVSGLVNLQAGVVEGHFRGGRTGEVLYLIDGIPVTDAYSGGAGVAAENHSIQELEIISGTFNAEYGQAMSGIVNQVTKDGGDSFGGEVSWYAGDYVSSNDDLFMNIGRIRPTDIYNIQGNLGGPLVLVPGVSFFVSGRLYYNDGHLYGKRVFLPTDSSDFRSDDPTRWHIGSSGDGAFVPMNFEKRTTVQTKLTINVSGSDKLRLQYMGQRRDSKSYDHRYKYNPEGTYDNFNDGQLASAGFTKVVSDDSFFELHGAWFRNREESYVHDDPLNPNYYPPYTRKSTVGGSAFLTGGSEELQFHRVSEYYLGKVDFVSQATTTHQIKAGVEVKHHRIWVNNFGVRNDASTGFQPRVDAQGRAEFADSVTIRPRQYAAYVQDKMEFDDLIVNLGFRVDFFDPQARSLVEPLTVSLIEAGSKPRTKRADSEFQMSPRIGLAFPITDRGVLHLSYGHFFQIPNFDLLYLNPSYNLTATQSFQVGNPGLRSERTVAYELGLQQQLSDQIALDVTGFYKDIRNLIGAQIFDLGNGTKYSQYINTDYGNVRGVIISLEKRHSDGVSATLDYTFQLAKSNSSDPNSAFNDNQTDPPRETLKQLAPMDWDRRHSLNATVTIGDPADYTVTVVGRLGSGLPYTPAFLNQRTGLVNSETRPSQVNVDLYATKQLELFSVPINVFVKVYNVFDTQNELNIFTDTGRAGYSLEARTGEGYRGYATKDEYYTRPDFYSAPRQVIAGFGVSF